MRHFATESGKSKGQFYNRKWIADFTYVWTAEGWLYVAAVVDLFSRRVVGWSMSAAMAAQLVTDALVMAIWRRGKPDALLHHSDRGSQYTSEQFQRLMADNGVVCSMSRSGNVWDNAAMESFFSSLKTERTARKMYRTRDEAKADVFDYIERQLIGARRARGVRNGLIIALLGYCPIRLKNFAALEIGNTFKEIKGSWWIILPSISTKTHRPNDRRVDELLYPAIDVYLNLARPVLRGTSPDTNALWISSTTGSSMTKKNLGILISKITLETVGVDVSPHLFRTAGVTTAAVLASNLPHLGSALLNHTDPRVAEEHYNRATSLRAAKIYAELVHRYQSR
jgi:integrase